MHGHVAIADQISRNTTCWATCWATHLKQSYNLAIFVPLRMCSVLLTRFVSATRLVKQFNTSKGKPHRLLIPNHTVCCTGMVIICDPIEGASPFCHKCELPQEGQITSWFCSLRPVTRRNTPQTLSYQTRLSPLD